jgi:predicted aspartyl protease
MHKTRYSEEYFPPAPVLKVSIAIPEESSTTREFSALVDTGSDGTLVPTSILDDFDLPISYMTNVRSHFGESLHSAPVYKVDLILFNSVRLPSIEIVGDDFGDRIILGRNVLNLLKLNLDGPGKTISVAKA